MPIVPIIHIVIPAQAGIQFFPLLRQSWIPAYAGMTKMECVARTRE